MRRSLRVPLFLAVFFFLPDLPAKASTFVRGDVDANGAHQVSDAIQIFGFLFLGNPKSLSCEDAADTNDTGNVDLTDGIYLLNYLFSGGKEPAAPFPACGTDFTNDTLTCKHHDSCTAPSACAGLLGTPCEEGEFCELPAGLCQAVDLQGECLSRPGACPEIFDPVCGCDGKTYGNDCERQVAGVQKDHDGECGAQATCGGFAGKPCGQGEFCDLPPASCSAADLEGECVPVPEGCPKNLDPVCGCDGKTYGNDCARQAAQVQKDHDGECVTQTACGGIAGLPCGRGQFCEVPPGLCDTVDLEGECLPIPEACLAIFKPVCGCDGKTYSNDCERQAAQVQKDHDGECAQ
jgi:hypothetical protein